MSASNSSASALERAEQRRCVLIADDNPLVRTVVRFFVECHKGLEVCGEATDGVDLIEKAKELRPDLIVLDLAMPRMNGLEAATKLKRMMPHVPIILFTMYKEVLGNSLVDVDAVLSKPEGMTGLVECVQRLLS
jgi:DNA-binding NarL/FixJ family response regulator